MYRAFVTICISGLLALPEMSVAAGTVQLPATNQTVCFATNGSPRACNNTGEDGEKRAGIPVPVPRFTDNGDGTVSDKLTGLMWSKHANAPSRALLGQPNNVCLNAEKDMIWLDALAFVACLNTKNHAGFSDWRLPNLNEMESLISSEVDDIAAYLNSSGFGFGPGLSSEVRAKHYWTSTSDASDVSVPALSASAAWDVDMAKGDFPSNLKNGQASAVWPVRGVSTGPARLWHTGQTLCFDDIGDPISCVATGADGEKRAGAAWPSPRFKPNTGATFALDRLTGLLWTRAAQTPGPAACAGTGLNIDWQQALDHVACLNVNAYLGRSDWRVPNRKELRSLVDYSRGAPALPVGNPFSDQAGISYWSATSNQISPKDVWVVSMFDGGLSSAAKEGTLPVWPVSGPDLVAPALAITQGNMTVNVASQTISGTVEAGATVTASINGGTPAAVSVNGTDWSFTIDPLAVGANNITVTATDFSENSASASISITMDTGAPALSLNPVTALTNKKSLALSGSVEEGATVVIVMGTTAIPATVSGTDWNAVIPALVEGANSVTVTATGITGNTSTLPPATIILDTVPPVTTATPVSGNYTDSVTVTLTASEAGSSIYYSTDGTSVTTASPVYSTPVRLGSSATIPFTVRFMAVDQAGNAEPVKRVDYTIYPGCDLNGDNTVDVRDALKALQTTVGLYTPTPAEVIRGDVGPLVNGKPTPNGIIDLADALTILQRSVGLVLPW